MPGSGDAAGNKIAVVLPFKAAEPAGGDSSSVGGDDSGYWGL